MDMVKPINRSHETDGRDDESRKRRFVEIGACSRQVGREGVAAVTATRKAEFQQQLAHEYASPSLDPSGAHRLKRRTAFTTIKRKLLGWKKQRCVIQHPHPQQSNGGSAKPPFNKTEEILVMKKKVTQNNAKGNSQPVNGSPIGQSPELNPEQFRIDQNFTSHVQTRKKAVSISVRKPDRQLWIYVHPGKDWRIIVGVLEDKVNQRTYIVAPEILPEVTADLVPKLLVTYATRQNTTSLWPVRIPDETGRLDSYNESALSIIEQYPGQWIRVLPNSEERCYDVLETPSIELPAPKWPDGGFKQLFSLAFKNRVISNINHPVLKALRGEGV